MTCMRHTITATASAVMPMITVLQRLRSSSAHDDGRGRQEHRGHEVHPELEQRSGRRVAQERRDDRDHDLGDQQQFDQGERADGQVARAPAGEAEHDAQEPGDDRDGHLGKGEPQDHRAASAADS